MEMAYAHGPLMLALDRRIFETSPEERLQARSSDLVAWTTTIFPVIHHSIREARAQLRTGHCEIRTYFSDMTAAEPTTNATPNAPTAPTIATVRTNSPTRHPTATSARTNTTS
jgi:hypothetical protein